MTSIIVLLQDQAMNLLKLTSGITFLLLFALSACTGDGSGGGKGEMTKKQLIGSWEVTKAERNRVETAMMDGLFFQFADKTLTTNFLGESFEYQYEYSDGKITQQGEPLITYLIESMEGDQLVLSTTLQAFEFRMEMKRVKTD